MSILEGFLPREVHCHGRDGPVVLMLREVVSEGGQYPWDEEIVSVPSISHLEGRVLSGLSHEDQVKDRGHRVFGEVSGWFIVWPDGSVKSNGRYTIDKQAIRARESKQQAQV